MNWYKKAQYNQYGIPLEFKEKTSVPFYDDSISDKQMEWYDPQKDQYIVGPKKQYYKERKGYNSEVKWMSPSYYIYLCAKGFLEKGEIKSTNINDAIKEVVQFRDKDKIEKYKDRWFNGEEPYMGYILYHNGSFYGQEGLHRALMAKDMGVKSIPVLIVDKKIT